MRATSAYGLSASFLDLLIVSRTVTCDSVPRLGVVLTRSGRLALPCQLFYLLMPYPQAKKSGSRSYLSSSVDVRTYDGFRRRPATSNLKLTQNYKRRAEAKRYRLEQISGTPVACSGVETEG